MRDRKGIILVAFDLPTETSDNRYNYRRFRSYLIKSGYIMFQESLYFKIVKTILHCSKEINEVSIHSPKNGSIIALPLTINELAKLKTISGSKIDMSMLTEEVVFY